MTAPRLLADTVPPPAGRWLWVDNAKAIGILLVVYGHVARGLQQAGLPIDNALFRSLDQLIYSFHMPLFFFLAGLFFSDSLQRRGHWGLFRNKLDTIVYPYAVWTVLQGSLESVLRHLTNRANPWPDGWDLLSVLWWPLAQFWFLFALFFVTLVALWCTPAVRPRHRWGLVISSVIAILLSNSPLVNLPVIGFVMGHLVYFVAGLVASDHPRWLNAHPMRLALPGALLLAGSLWERQQHPDLTGMALEALKLIGACGGIAAVLGLARWSARMDRGWLSRLGQSSMEIYLAHVIAGSGCRIVLLKLMHVNSVSLHLLAGCLVGLGLPLLLKQLTERWVVLQALFSPPWTAGKIAESVRPPKP